ncbi:MAG: ABC transporter substrate-binding protein [Nitrospinota bacterium]
MRIARLVWISLLVLSFSAFFRVPAAQARDVVFCFAWVPYGKHVGFYVALEKGYWKEEGLNVKMIRGVSGMDNAKRVNTGACTVASGGVDTLVIARSQGFKARAIGVWHTKSMHVIFARKDRGINTVKDLEGKRIATVAKEDGQVLFPAFAKAAGIDASKVKFVEMDWGSKNPSLISGSVDATVTFVTVRPNILKVAKKSNVPIAEFLYADHGLDLYSNGFLATEKRIAEEGDFLRRFLRAALRGLAYGVDHPGEGVDIFNKYKPEISKDLAAAHWRIAVEHLVTPDTEMNGLGHIGYRKMKFTRDVIAEARNIKNVEPVQNYFTNEFLTPIFPKRPKM